MEYDSAVCIYKKRYDTYVKGFHYHLYINIILLCRTIGICLLVSLRIIPSLRYVINVKDMKKKATKVYIFRCI